MKSERARLSLSHHGHVAAVFRLVFCVIQKNGRILIARTLFLKLRCSSGIGTFRISLDFIYIQTSSRVYLDFIQSSSSSDLDLEFLQCLSRVSLVLLSRSRLDLDLIQNFGQGPVKNSIDKLQIKSRKPVARFVVQLQIQPRSRSNLDQSRSR